MIIRYLLLIVFMLLRINQSFALADTPSDTSQKLQTIDKKIHTLEKKLTITQIQQQKLKGSLKRTEVNIGFISKKISKTKKKLTDTQKLLQKHQQKKLSYEARLEKQQELLPTEISAISQLSTHPALKIFLNRENPEQINRHLYYLRCISEAHIEQIHQIQQTMDTMSAATTHVKQQQRNLQKIQHQQLTQEQKLAIEKSKRQSLLKNTEKTLRGTLQELNQLKQDKQRLETVLKKIRTPVTATSFTWNTEGVASQQIVTSGSVVQRYGQLLANGQWRSTGTIIAAPPGSPIHAIADGQIVFADWLKGFGLIVIVQHGQNYLSLYGRDQSVYVKVGQKIHTGDVIATVGNSGGFTDNGLYFEVRHQGKPIDPKRWL